MAMVFSKDGSGYFFVEPGSAAGYRGDRFGVAGVDKFDVKSQASSVDTKAATIDIEDIPGDIALGYQAIGMQEVSPEVYGEIEGVDQTDPRISGAIESAEGWEYEEDPMLVEAQRMGEQYRTDQRSALRRLSELTLGRDTVSEQRAGTAATRLGTELVGQMGGDQERAAMRAYEMAMGDLSSQSARDVVAERAAQTSAIGSGIQSVLGATQSASNVDRQRELNRRTAWLENQQRVQELKDLASTLRRQKASGALSDAEASSAIDQALSQMPSLPSAATPIAASVLGAAGTGLQAVSDMNAGAKRSTAGTWPGATAPDGYGKIGLDEYLGTLSQIRGAG
jgi:hypothetical protein